MLSSCGRSHCIRPTSQSNSRIIEVLWLCEFSAKHPGIAGYSEEVFKGSVVKSQVSVNKWRIREYTAKVGYGWMYASGYEAVGIAGRVSGGKSSGEVANKERLYIIGSTNRL